MLITSLPDPAVAEVAVALAVVVPMLAAAAVPTSRDGLRAAALAGWSGASVALAGSVALVAAGALDAVRGTLLVFAAGLAAVAIGFSARHLDGDLRAGRYRRRLLVTSAAAVTTLVVSDVAVLAVAWGLAGWGLTGLVGHHDDLPASGPAVAAMRRTLRAGDVALLVSLAVLVLGAGTTSVTGIAVWAASAPAGVMSVVGAGLLVATAARSAQWPFCRWLPLSVVAPAPVSALLHAGIANAPVVVLLGLFPVWRTIGWFAPALAVLGLGTAVVTFVRLLVRADVKTRLAWSTTAQLGFMLALLAVGAHAAAVIHLMLHGLYKANAFLRAGEDISLARRDRPLPATHRTRVGGAVAGAVAGLGILATDGAWNHPLTAAATLVAATAGGYGLWSLRARPAVRALAVLIAAGTLGVVLGGARVVGGLWALPADPAVEADGAAAWTAAAVVCALGLVGAVLRTRRPVPVWAVLHRASDPSLGLLDVLRLRIARRTAGTAGRATPAPAGAGPAAADEVVELVALAAEGLPPTWSWQGSVAANPLWGSRSMPFADALAESLRVQGPGAAAHRSRAEAAVDEAVAGWLAVWTAPDGPAWPAPSRDLDLWLWFRTVAVRDPLLAGIGARGGASVRELPDRAVDLVARAVADAVAAGWPDGRVWVADELGRLVGWAAYVARRNTAAAAVDVDALVGLLAVRVATRRALTGSLVPRAQADGADLPTRRAGTAQERSVAVVAALEAAESQVRAPLVVALTSALDGATTDAPAAAEERPEADLVLCIDVRSERLRRHLESQGR